MEYPKYKYHSEFEPIVVFNKEEEMALEKKGFKNSLADFGIETHPSAVVIKEDRMEPKSNKHNKKVSDGAEK